VFIATVTRSTGIKEWDFLHNTGNDYIIITRFQEYCYENRMWDVKLRLV